MGSTEHPRGDDAAAEPLCDDENLGEESPRGGDSVGTVLPHNEDAGAAPLHDDDMGPEPLHDVDMGTASPHDDDVGTTPLRNDYHEYRAPARQRSRTTMTTRAPHPCETTTARAQRPALRR